LTAASGSMPLLLPSPQRLRRMPWCVTGSALSFSLSGQHVGAASFTLCYGLLFCFPFSGTFGNASTQSVTRLHWLPAIRRPDTYRKWTSTSEQTMTFQDTPRCVGRTHRTPDLKSENQNHCKSDTIISRTLTSGKNPEITTCINLIQTVGFITEAVQ